VALDDKADPNDEDEDDDTERAAAEASAPLDDDDESDASDAPQMSKLDKRFGGDYQAYAEKHGYRSFQERYRR
jgi:hypothetical protein